jgi:hypothetical protein
MILSDNVVHLITLIGINRNKGHVIELYKSLAVVLLEVHRLITVSRVLIGFGDVLVREHIFLVG